MTPRAEMRMLSDGRRLHLQDGPIDLIVEVFGRPREVQLAYEAACYRFVSVLDELCSELPFLRQQCHPDSDWPQGPVARRMFAAVLPYACKHFITPMAAVAGAVAEDILATIIRAADISRAYVNNGGDIAIHLTGGEKFVIGMVERPDRRSLFGTLTLSSDHPARGIATSGWRGRSFSLGIADAVTVLADHAAAADAAATIIANAVDLPGHPAIVRVPARQLAPDSDLGDICVTQAVWRLTISEVEDALASGAHVAGQLRKIGLIRAAALNLAGETRLVAGPAEVISPAAHERSLVHA